MDTLILGRVIERLIVVLTGAASIYWGYRLFNARVLGRQDAEFAKGDWRIVLRGAAPGIFFSLFGSAIIMGSWISPLTLKTKSIQDATSTDKSPQIAQQPLKSQPVHATLDVTYFGNLLALDPKPVYALNTAIRLAYENNESKRQILLSDLQRAGPTLKSLRLQFVTNLFGSDAIQKWDALHEQYETRPDSLPLTDRQLLGSLEPWMTNSFADEK